MDDAFPEPARDGGAGSVFETTRWSLVYRAGSGDATALGELLRVYDRPVLAYCFAWWADDGTVAPEDVKQDFLLELATGNLLALAVEGRGRFRSLLLTALDRYVAGVWRKKLAAKRGGRLLRLDVSELELLADRGELAEEAFDGKLREVFLQRVTARLRRDWAARGEEKAFLALYPMVFGKEDALKQREAAAKLGVPQGSIGAWLDRLKAEIPPAEREELISLCGRADAESEDILRVRGRVAFSDFKKRRKRGSADISRKGRADGKEAGDECDE